MDELAGAIDDVAETLKTGTPPGKPSQTYIPRYTTGTVTATGISGVTVQFASDPARPTISLATLPFTGPIPNVGDVVLVMQLPHQRLVIGALTHEDWTTVSSYSNGWGAFDAVNYPVGYRRVNGIVFLRGLISGGVVGNQIAFVLPAGYRPQRPEINGKMFPVVSNDAFGFVRIGPQGNVKPWNGSNVYFELDSISFPAEQ